MPPEFSVVITCYFEERSIAEFHARLSAAVRGLGRAVEIVMVNDGSTDRTFACLQQIYAGDPLVSVILDLTRNFGQPAAVTAGINEARGRHIILMDSDLQLDPEELPLLIAAFDAGADAVGGYRLRRDDPLLRRCLSWFASFALRHAAGTRVRDFGCTFRVLNGNLVRGFRYGPYKLFNQTEVISRTNRNREVPVSHHARKYGKSGWTLAKLFDFYMESFINVSSRPFQAVAIATGLAAAVLVLRTLAGFFVSFAIMREVTNGLLLNAVVASALFIISVLVIAGEFVLRAFRILQGNPRYIIRQAQRRQPHAVPALHAYTEVREAG